ncbi:hypothetical protein [Enterococcus sp. LJL90]
MKKIATWTALLTIVFSLANFILALRYLPLYAYFNTNNQLGGFLIAVQFFRVLIYILTIIGGYWALRQQKTRAMLFYVAFFLFNLLLPFLFSIN